MSTADFKKNVLGKSSNSFASEDDGPSDVDFASSQFSDSSDDNDVDSQFSDSSAEEQVEEATEEPVEQTESEDWSWAESFKGFRDGVHGLATAELLQALSEGTIPEALMDKLSLTMKDGDEEWTGTVADLRNGAQMHANYTKKSQAFAQEKKQFESERGELIDYLRSWREDESGEKGLAGLEKMLGAESVMRIATKLAQRLERKDQLEALEAEGRIPAGTAAALLEREALQREVEEARNYKARLAQQKEQSQAQEQGTQLGKRLNQEAVNQFKLAGITQEAGTLTQGMWNLFKEEMSTIWTDANHVPTPAEVRTAVMAAKQRAERLERQYVAEKAKTAPKKAPVTGATPQAAPGAPKQSVGSAKKHLSTKEFKNQFMGGGGFGGRR